MRRNYSPKIRDCINTNDMDSEDTDGLRSRMQTIARIRAGEITIDSVRRGEIRNRLRVLVQRSGLDQRTLSDATKLTESSVSRYLSGERIPRGAALSVLASVLGTSPEYILGETNNMAPSGMKEDIAEAYSILQRHSFNMTLEDKARFVKVLFRV